MALDDDILLAGRLADAARGPVRRWFRAGWTAATKADASPVTEADREAEAAMRAILAAERPGDGIVGEEYGNEREGADRIWVLDPIDGTRSFIAGRPIFGTLIALIEDGAPVLGVIDQAVGGERWLGAEGRPTTFNGARCTTRACAGLAAAHLATTSPWLFHGAGEREAFERMRLASRDLLLGGDCYNYAMVAQGQLDLVVETGLKLYDFAALVPVVEGAGGRMTDWTGQPLGIGSDGRVIAAGDAALVEQVLALV